MLLRRLSSYHDFLTTDSILPILLIDGHSRAISGKETRRAAINLIVKFLNLILIVHLEEMEEYRKEK